MRAVRLAWLIVVASVSQAWSWGQEGHAIVAEIAQRRLDPATLGKIDALLALEVPSLDHPRVALASIAGWADDYRADHKDTGGWHFVNIPDDRSTYDPDADCKGGNCVIEAIARFRAILADCSKPAPERLQALKFIVHFVGDIHQPLHASDRWDAYTGKDDQGGNLVPVTFFGQSTNLHVLWDTGLIMHTVYNWGAYVARLETSWFPGRDLTGLRGGSPIDWAVDAHRLAHDISYDFPDDGVLGVKYFSKASPIVERQLALAGIRLAQVLTDTLSTAACH
jgi:hypothetical protein